MGTDDVHGSSDRGKQVPEAILLALLAAISRATWARGAAERADRDLGRALGPAVVTSVMLCGNVIGDELALAVADAERLRGQVANSATSRAKTSPAPEAVTALLEPEPLLLSVAEAARLLGVSRDALDKRIQRGQVPGVIRTGRRVQVHRAKLLATLERRAR